MKTSRSNTSITKVYDKELKALLMNDLKAFKNSGSRFQSNNSGSPANTLMVA